MRNEGNQSIETGFAPACPCKKYIIPLLTFLGTLFFTLLAWQVDFHPDETIYFEAIPLSLRNDTGLFYSFVYSLPSFFFGPIGARLVSAFLGGGTLFFVLRTAHLLSFRRQRLLAVGVVFLLSYQSIFIFDRVRPEAAWWFLSSASFYGCLLLCEAPSRARYIFTFLALLLLPMNHRLSWFPAAFLGGYVLFFMPSIIGRWRTVGLLSAMVLGVMINLFGRALLIGATFGEALSGAMQSPSGHIGSPLVFFKNVFYGAPLFLNDRAIHLNLYEKALSYVHQDSGMASHAFVQNSFWLLLFVLPFWGRTVRQRYVLSFPFFVFVAFYFSGYFNPTYAPGLSLCCVLFSAFFIQEEKKPLRIAATIILSVSLLTGLSFLSTRLLNHGAATYFEQEDALHAFIRTLPEGKKIAISERFQSATRGYKGGRTILYKEALPVDVDYVFYDQYDDVMYQFVPEFEERKAALHARLDKVFCPRVLVRTPVYKGDALYPGAQSFLDNKANVPYSGSWFFRNSVSYGLYQGSPCL